MNIVAKSSSYGYVGYYAKHIITDPADSCLKTVGEYIFYDDGTNRYLVRYTGTDTELTLPDYNGQTYSIYQYAFYKCTSLTSITIPDSVTSIEDYAFRGCTDLQTITYTGTTEQWNKITKGSGWNLSTGRYTLICLGDSAS